MEPAEPQVARLPRAGGEAAEILVDGVPTPCYHGETVATAILAQRPWIAFDGVRRHGLFCGIGVCFECAVTIDGLPGERACMTSVVPGMEVTTDRSGRNPSADDSRPRP